MKKSFTEKVYEIAKRIPRGKVATYGQIARLAGNARAARAVGMAMKCNSDTSIIPCHRVVTSDGGLTGYAFGGIPAKKSLLLKEGVHFSGNKVNLALSKWNHEK